MKSRPGTLLHNRFEVVEVLAGGMGIVYLCLDREGDVPAALKTFRPELLPDRSARDRFLREGTTWVRLGQHPHIVRCYQVFSARFELEVYLHLEWVAHAEGKRDASLRAWMRPGVPLSLDQAMHFALHVTRGMKHATARIDGLVHRDLKPENILVGRDGLARITDFGLASALTGLDTQSGVSRPPTSGLHRTQLTRGIVGTPLYMAPEQWDSEAALDARADIYAFGCILYEMATGRAAVSGSTVDELERAHRQGQLSELPDGLPEELAALLLRCLSTRPSARYKGWTHVEEALKAAYRTVMGSSAPAEARARDLTRVDRTMEGWSYQAIGNAYRELGKYQRAKTYYQRVGQIAVDEGDDNLEATALYSLGSINTDVGDPRQAIEYYQDALARAPRAGQVEGPTLMGLGNAHRDLGQMEQAIDYYDQALGSAQRAGEPGLQGSILISRGNALRRVGRLKSAVESYREALSIAQELKARRMEGTVRGNLGIAYRLLGEPQRAVQAQIQAYTISKRMGDRAGEGRALNNLGLALSDLGDTERALLAYNEALLISKETGMRRFESTVLTNIGNAYRILEETGRATEFSRQAIIIAEETEDFLGVAQCHLNLAVLAGEMGEQADALRHARAAEGLFEQVGHVQLARTASQLVGQLGGLAKATEHCERAAALGDRGLWREAARESQAALRINSNNALAHHNLAVSHLNLGHLDKAVREFQIALQIAPSFPPPHAGLGQAYAQQGRAEEAINELKAYLELHSDDAQVRYSLGVLYWQQGKLEEAIQEYQTVLRINPHEPEIHYKLGLCYWDQGRLDQAKSAWQTTLRLDPDHAYAHHSLGLVHANQGRLMQAIREYQAALRLDPNHHGARYDLGVVYYAQGRVPEALRELQAAARMGNPDAAALLAEMRA